MSLFLEERLFRQDAIIDRSITEKVNIAEMLFCVISVTVT